MSVSRFWWKWLILPWFLFPESSWYHVALPRYQDSFHFCRHGRKSRPSEIPASFEEAQPVSSGIKADVAFRAHSSVDLIGILQREWRDTVQVTLRWLLACCPRGRQKETLASLSWPAVSHLLAWTHARTSVFGAKWAPERCEWLKPTLPTVGFKIAWRFLTWKRKLTLLYF